LRMGCEEGQGYCFGRPMPVPAFEAQFLAAPETEPAAGAAA
jgi:EAL domain-containing protein (putative c-di-GMP-specific phosphodiesterase class I)